MMVYLLEFLEINQSNTWLQVSNNQSILFFQSLDYDYSVGINKEIGLHVHSTMEFN